MLSVLDELLHVLDDNSLYNESNKSLEDENQNENRCEICDLEFANKKKPFAPRKKPT